MDDPRLSELEGKTVKEFKKAGTKEAKQMLKLVKQSKRLMEKLKGKK
jgi:hypothetical protein